MLLGTGVEGTVLMVGATGSRGCCTKVMMVGATGSRGCCTDGGCYWE